MNNIDLYIKDRSSGQIHRIGDDPHDSLYVDHNGSVHYFNLQCGDGAGPYSLLNKDYGFEFVQSDCGEPDDESVLEAAEKFRKAKEAFREKQKDMAAQGIILMS